MYFQMYWIIFVVVIGSLNNIGARSQRVPPGVPPQHYLQGHQQPSHPQQTYEQTHDQQMFQHQQQQQQQQQQQHVPMQQGNFQQMPVQQQPPVHQPHAGGQYNPTPQMGGHHDNPSQQILHSLHMDEEKDHIQEHLDVPIDISKMSEQELQFHYFKMHDADNNNQLDGCELIKSLIHWHEQDHKTHDQKDPAAHPTKNKLFTDEELEVLIDPILNTDDRNTDGFIDYPEFIRAQQNSAATGRTQ